MHLRTIKTLLVVAVAVVFAACGAKKDDANDEAHAEGEAKEWKEMDEFHMVMAETFHPYKDSSNLEPAKAKAAELAESANQWSSASLPKRVDNDEMKTKLENLKTETASFVQTASGSDDKAIGDQLTKIHDLFHEIQEDWYGGEGHKHH